VDPSNGERDEGSIYIVGILSFTWKQAMYTHEQVFFLPKSFSFLSFVRNCGKRDIRQMVPSLSSHHGDIEPPPPFFIVKILSSEREKKVNITLCFMGLRH